MRSPDEIKKILSKCKVAQSCSFCGFKQLCEFYDEVLAYILELEKSTQDFVDIIHALAEQTSEWISVEDGLPEDGEYVLCWYTDEGGNSWHTVGKVEEDTERWILDIEGAYDFERTVTHWMPLPEPPEKSEDKNDE